MSRYEELLFHRMNVYRLTDDGQKYDSKQKEKEIDTDIKCAIIKKNQSKINEKPGRTEVDSTMMLHTLYAELKTGDIIQVYDPNTGYSFGRYIASVPYPVMDRNGIHHFEVDLKDEVDV